LADRNLYATLVVYPVSEPSFVLPSSATVELSPNPLEHVVDVWPRVATLLSSGQHSHTFIRIALSNEGSMLDAGAYAACIATLFSVAGMERSSVTLDGFVHSTESSFAVIACFVDRAIFEDLDVDDSIRMSVLLGSPRRVIVGLDGQGALVPNHVTGIATRVFPQASSWARTGIRSSLLMIGNDTTG